METQNKKQATVNGKDLPISAKHAASILRFLKGRKINDSIELLEKVIKKKIAVPVIGEVPHKNGYPGRYHVKAAGFFIKMLKNLAANATQKGMNLEMIRVSGMANLASRASKPGRLGRRKFKRTHVLLVGEEKI